LWEAFSFGVNLKINSTKFSQINAKPISIGTGFSPFSKIIRINGFSQNLNAKR
jgi:hypothetical protein